VLTKDEGDEEYGGMYTHTRRSFQSFEPSLNGCLEGVQGFTQVPKLKERSRFLIGSNSLGIAQDLSRIL
jgi:hypothetical protein